MSPTFIADSDKPSATDVANIVMNILGELWADIFDSHPTTESVTEVNWVHTCCSAYMKQYDPVFFWLAMNMWLY